MSDPATMFLSRPGGRIAFDDRGAGPLIVLSPGMGDLRSSYRHLTPLLLEAGYRVVSVDLRGHGDSDAGFDDYGDAATAGDLLAIIEHVGRARSITSPEPAVIVGNSMSAGAAVIAAAHTPSLVRALVLTGPFVRQPSGSKLQAALFRIAMTRPWATAVWKAYLPSLHAGRLPDDFAAHREAIAAALRRPDHARAFVRTTRTDHTPAENALATVDAPTLVVMGTLDPDFSDPALEAREVAAALRGRAVMIDEAGHYPHAQQPEHTAAAIAAFLQEVGIHA